MREPASRRLRAALAASLLLHLGLLALLPRGEQAGNGSQRPPLPTALAVDLPDITPPVRDSAGDTSGPAPLPDTALEQQPLPPPDPRAVALGGDSGIAGTHYYAAHELDFLPLAQNDPLLENAQLEQHRDSGQLILRLWISAQGEVERIDLEDSQLPALFNDLARQAFAGVRFSPGFRNGQAVPSLLRIEVNYAALMP